MSHSFYNDPTSKTEVVTPSFGREGNHTIKPSGGIDHPPFRSCISRRFLLGTTSRILVQSDGLSRGECTHGYSSTPSHLKPPPSNPTCGSTKTVRVIALEGGQLCTSQKTSRKYLEAIASNPSSSTIVLRPTQPNNYEQGSSPTPRRPDLSQ